jgi:hypothetical protein
VPFTFTIYLIDTDDTPLADSTVAYIGGLVEGSGTTEVPTDGSIEGGTAIVELTHGQSITLQRVPIDVRIRFVATPESNYRTSYTDSRGIREANNDTGFLQAGFYKEGRTFEFVNTSFTVSSGLHDFSSSGTSNPAPLAAAGSSLAAGWIVVEVVRRKIMSAQAAKAVAIFLK